MAKTLTAIMRELDKSGGYAADRKLLSSQLKALPNQYRAQAAGLDAKLTQANDNILQGARGRGIGFSGIPIAEQAQYAATEYAPALANLKSQSEQSRVGILQSLNSLSRDQRGQAQSIFDTNRSFREQQRQFNEQQRLAREQMRQSAASAGGGASAGDYLSALMGGSGGGSSTKGTQAKMVKRKDGGFNFTVGGKAVSAAQFAQITKTPFRNLLSTMAKQGDKGAKAALGFVGNDFGYDPRKIGSSSSLYNALVWGTGRKYTGGASASKPKTTTIGGQKMRWDSARVRWVPA